MLGRRSAAFLQVVFRVGIALLASAQEQLCAMPFERLVAALNGRKFPILNKQPDALMKVSLQAHASSCLHLGIDLVLHVLQACICPSSARACHINAVL
jgi:hypothetical protein